jgi:putative transposase
LVLRAKIVLEAATGAQNVEIGKTLGVSRSTAGKWRERFVRLGIQGLYDEYRPGRPRSVDDEQVAELVNKTLHSKPEGATQWSTRDMAQQSGISKSTVHRVWSAFGLKPHRQDSFKLSTDPFFIEKLRDIVGLYLNPPENALVLCVDEKSQCQALERSQPMLPLGLGYVEGVTHDYVRHGITTLFAALDIANGQVLTDCKPRHRNQEFLGFLKRIERNVPPELDVYLVMDNYATHKHANVKAWFARHPRFHPHFVPTYASWLNQVERWFALITQKAIRRGSFRSVKELVLKIEQFVAAYNKKAAPFVWVATADSILAKIERLCERISGTGH